MRRECVSAEAHQPSEGRTGALAVAGGARSAGAEALAAHGFEQGDLDEGFRRIKSLTDGGLERRAPADDTRALLAELDAWENRWYPVINATLKSRHPEAHAWLFNNLKQTRGVMLMGYVTLLVERLRKLPTERALGANGKVARALLEKRGLTGAVVQHAGDLADALRNFSGSRPAPPARDLEAEQKAEAALWGWYLEWSEIARAAIKDRRLLRELGLAQAKKAASKPGANQEESAS